MKTLNNTAYNFKHAWATLIAVQEVRHLQKIVSQGCTLISLRYCYALSAVSFAVGRYIVEKVLLAIL